MSDSRVIDASYAFHLLLPGAKQAALQVQMGRWRSEGQALYAPDLWLYEITSALTKAVHLGALTASQGRAALELGLSLPLTLAPPDAALARRAYEWTLELERAAAYDSAYLALAESLGCGLWTADGRLGRAVNLPWVHVV